MLGASNPVVAVGREGVASLLIGEDEEDVGLFRRHGYGSHFSKNRCQFLYMMFSMSSCV